jgi:3',5'-cyclic AMP phosphodiesterase CpdA
MKKLLILQLSLVLMLGYSCKKDDAWKNQPGTTQSADELTKKMYDQYKSGHIKIAVLSDVHYMHPSLMQNNAENGAEFKSYLISNPNKAMQQYSAPIFEQVLQELKYQKPDLVLLAGDMTKDGEKVSHEFVAGALANLESIGCKVYLVPGNNDINNNTAFGYDGNTKYPVTNVTPAEFATLYDAFGYGEAISKDPNSLSYIAEPFPGLWILAIDACKYAPRYSRSGLIKPGTMQWMSEQLAIASQNNVTVLGLMHHNLMNHMQDQNSYMGPTVLDNSSAAVEALIAGGVKVIFTGHNHSNDITQYSSNGNSIYDVETGSLVGPPSPYRMIVLKNKELDISTNYINTIDAALPDGMSFKDYSDAKLANLLDKYFTVGLAGGTYSLPTQLLSTAVPLASNAYAAHMAGDEYLSPEEQLKIAALKQQIDALNIEPKPTKTIDAVNSLWNDLGIKDGKWYFKVQNQ